MNPTVQRTQALERANRVRSVRAVMKRELAAQTKPIALAMAREAIVAPEPELDGLRVEELLRSVRYLGVGKVNGIMRRATVSPRRRLGELTPAERARLDGALR